MAILQHGDKYQVVYSNGQWVITWTDDTALADGTLFNIGVDPEAGSSVSAALTGTAITGGVLESEIQDGNETIIITLTGDTFVDSASSEDGIAAGMDGSASWDSEVTANTDNTDIALSGTGNNIATITLPAAASYAISANDTITITIPADSLTDSTTALVCSTFDVTNESAGWAHELNAVAAANIAEINGIAIANIVEINGV